MSRGYLQYGQDRREYPLGRDEAGESRCRSPGHTNILAWVAVFGGAAQVFAQYVFAKHICCRVYPGADNAVRRAMDSGFAERLSGGDGGGVKSGFDHADWELPRVMVVGVAAALDEQNTRFVANDRDRHSQGLSCGGCGCVV